MPFNIILNKLSDSSNNGIKKNMTILAMKNILWKRKFPPFSRIS